MSRGVSNVFREETSKKTETRGLNKAKGKKFCILLQDMGRKVCCGDEVNTMPATDVTATGDINEDDNTR